MLLSVDDGYRYYKIEDVNEFRKIRHLLVKPMTEMQNQLPLERTVNQLLDQTDGRLDTKDNFFALWLVTSNGKIVTTLTTSIVLNENYDLCCYVNGRYFKKGMLREMGKKAWHYLEEWAMQKQCLKMVFLTSRNSKAYTRLLNNIGLKPSETLFIKELNYEFTIPTSDTN